MDGYRCYVRYDKIIRNLERGPCSCKQMAEQTGVPLATVYNIIGNLRKRDVVFNCGGKLINGKRTAYYMLKGYDRK